MIKKLISIILIIALCLNSLFATAQIDLNTLTPEQQQIFLDNSLSIQSNYDTYSYNGGYGTALGKSAVYNGWGNSKTELKWKAFQGPNEITKKELYQLTNQYDLAEKAAKNEKFLRNMKITGGCIIGISALAGIGFGIAAYYNIPNTTVAHSTVAALAMTFLGSCIGVPFIMVKPKEDVPVSFAINIASLYNQSLYESLR